MSSTKEEEEAEAAAAASKGTYSAIHGKYKPAREEIQ